MSSFGYLTLKRPMAGALEAVAEPLRFLVGVHNPPLPLGNVALLLFPGLFCLLGSQLCSHQLIRVGLQLLLELASLLDDIAQLLVERPQPTKALSNGGVTISRSSRLPSLQGVEVQLATSPCRTFWGLSEDLLMPLIGEYAYLFSGGPQRRGNSGQGFGSSSTEQLTRWCHPCIIVHLEKDPQEALGSLVSSGMVKSANIPSKQLPPEVEGGVTQPPGHLYRGRTPRRIYDKGDPRPQEQRG
ncbi:hypothetical protein BHM03_00019359 [Ensete ventricosum]|nr:hypothetical protein BHM03_00019359 [Ensete ventricosum]